MVICAEQVCAVALVSGSLPSVVYRMVAPWVESLMVMTLLGDPLVYSVPAGWLKAGVATWPMAAKVTVVVTAVAAP